MRCKDINHKVKKHKVKLKLKKQIKIKPIVGIGKFFWLKSFSVYKIRGVEKESNLSDIKIAEIHSVLFQYLVGYRYLLFTLLIIDFTHYVTLFIIAIADQSIFVHFQ